MLSAAVKEYLKNIKRGPAAIFLPEIFRSYGPHFVKALPHPDEWDKGQAKFDSL